MWKKYRIIRIELILHKNHNSLEKTFEKAISIFLLNEKKKKINIMTHNSAPKCILLAFYLFPTILFYAINFNKIICHTIEIVSVSFILICFFFFSILLCLQLWTTFWRCSAGGTTDQYDSASGQQHTFELQNISAAR